MDLIAYIQKNPFFLAPMAGVTDKAFRSFMREMGCGVITSELVSARALKENSKRTIQLINFDESHRPYGIQIFGESADIIAEGAKKVEGCGVDFIDLNLGCPVNKIVKRGAGSALLKDLKKLKQVLSALKSSVSLPVSLKIRTGWDDKTRNADQVAKIALEEGFEWMSIHGRTRSQAYSGTADWNYIKHVNSQTDLKIVGNGDLVTGEQAYSFLKRSSCFAVMVGRGCLYDPWIFLSAMEFFNRKLSKEKKGKSALIKDYNKAIHRLKEHLEDFYDERLFLLQLKKFAVWFSSGFPNSSDFRRDLFQEKNKTSVVEKIEDFFMKNQYFQKATPVYEPFLMQGHG